MTKLLSMDVRDRAMVRLDAGETVGMVVEVLSGTVQRGQVVEAPSCHRESAAPGKIGEHVRRKIKGEQAAWLRARMAAGPVYTARSGGGTGGARAA